MLDDNTIIDPTYGQFGFDDKLYVFDHSENYILEETTVRHIETGILIY